MTPIKHSKNCRCDQCYRGGKPQWHRRSCICEKCWPFPGHMEECECYDCNMYRTCKVLRMYNEDMRRTKEEGVAPTAVVEETEEGEEKNSTDTDGQGELF